MPPNDAVSRGIEMFPGAGWGMASPAPRGSALRQEAAVPWRPGDALDVSLAAERFYKATHPVSPLSAVEEVSLLDVKRLSRAQLERLDGGKALLDITQANAKGRYGFVEGVTNWGLYDLPYVGDVVGDAIPIREMPRVVSTIKKLNRGEMVSDQDLVYAQLYLANQERKAQATTGGMIGDGLRGLGGFAAEIGISTAIGSAVAGPGPGTATGFVAGTATGGARLVRKGIRKLIHTFADDAVEAAAGKLAQKLMARTVGRASVRKFGLGMANMAVEGTRNLAIDSAVNAAVNIANGEDPLMSRQAGDRYIGANLSGDDMTMREAQMLALGDRYVEYLSEASGEAIGEAIFGAGGSMGKMAKLLETTYPKAYGTKALVRAKAATYVGAAKIASKLTVDGNPKTMLEWLKNVGYNGYIEEMLEERLGGAARGFFGLSGDEDENRFKRMLREAIPDRQQFIVEAVTFAVPMVTTLAAAKAHRALAGVDTAQSTEDLRRVLQASAELEAPAVERIGDEIKVSGGRKSAGTYADALDSLDRLRQLDKKRPEGPLARIADVAVSLAEVAISGNFAPLVQRSNIGQVLSRYGRENLAATWNAVEKALESDAADAYASLTPDQRKAKVDATARKIMTEALGVARKSLVLQEDALSKAVEQIEGLPTEEAKKAVVDALQARMAETGEAAPGLSLLPVGRGRSYHDLFVRTGEGHPLSSSIINLDKAVSDTLARHGIMQERKIVDNASEVTVDSMAGVEVPLADIDAMLSDPFSMVTSLLAGTVGINVGIAGAPKRLATLLNRHKALYESGAKGTVFKRESADHRGVESSVRLYVLPDGTAVFRPSHDNEGTPEAAAARRARSDADAARLNQTISAAANAMTAKQAAVDAGFAPDDTPATLKFSKHTLLANKDPRVLTSVYNYHATSEADAERYIREVLFGAKMKDGHWVVGTGNLNDDNEVVVRAAVNLYHVWEETSELRIKLQNAMRRGGIYNFDKAVVDFIDVVRKLAAARLRSVDSDASGDKLQWNALLDLINFKTTDAPVKLFGQLLLGYNLTDDVVGERLAYSDQIEALRPELMQHPLFADFVRSVGEAVGLFRAGSDAVVEAEFELQVNPYLDVAERMRVKLELARALKPVAAAPAAAAAKPAAAAAAPAAPKPAVAAAAPAAAAAKPAVAPKPAVAAAAPVAAKPAPKPAVAAAAPAAAKPAPKPATPTAAPAAAAKPAPKPATPAQSFTINTVSLDEERGNAVAPAPAPAASAPVAPAPAASAPVASAPVASAPVAPAPVAPAPVAPAPVVPTAPAPAAPRAKPLVSQSRKSYMSALAPLLANYFAPGNVVEGYSGYDRVISFVQETPEATWNVTVRSVIRGADGQWVDDPEDSRVRNHSTQPSPDALRAGPVYSSGQARVAKSEVPAVEPDVQAPVQAAPVPEAPVPANRGLPGGVEAKAPAANRAKRLNVRGDKGRPKSTFSTTAVLPIGIPEYREAQIPRWVNPPIADIAPVDFFAEGQYISEQAAYIALVQRTPSAIRSVAKAIGVDSPGLVVPVSYDAEPAGEGVVDDPVSDSEFASLADQNVRALRGVAPLANAFEYFFGDNGFQGLFRLVNAPESRERLAVAASGDAEMLAWLDAKSPGEEQVETAFKAMVRYMNVLAESQGDEGSAGFGSRHLADLVGVMSSMVQRPAGEDVFSADGSTKFDMLNRSNPERKLRALAEARLATFAVDPLAEGAKLAEEFQGVADMLPRPPESLGLLTPYDVAQELRAPSSPFKTELFRFLHKFTGAPTLYFESASHTDEGRKVIGGLVAHNLAYWFGGAEMKSPNVDRIGGEAFGKLGDTEAGRKRAAYLLRRAQSDSWTDVAKALAAKEGALPNLVKVMRHANVSEGTVEPTYRDSARKGQAGWVQRSKFDRYVGEFYRAVGAPEMADDLYSVELVNGTRLPDGELVDFGDMPVDLMRRTVLERAKRGYLYPGVYGDKVNRAFVKLPEISVEAAAAAYRKLYEAPSNTLLDQATWVSPDYVDSLAAEHAALAARDAKTLSKKESDRRDFLEAEVKRIRFVTEFDRIVDGDARFYVPKMPAGLAFPEFLGKTVAENGGSISPEQRKRPDVLRVAGQLLDARTKRRGNDLTGGRGLESIERHLQTLTGRPDGKVRVLVVKNPLLGKSTDGMAVFRASTFGTAYVSAMGENFSKSEQSASTVKFQITGTNEVEGARVPVLDKLNSVSIEQLSRDPERPEARALEQMMIDADVDIVIFDSAEKVPSGVAYALGFLADDRLDLKSPGDLGSVRAARQANELKRSVDGSSFTVPVVLAASTEPAHVRFAKQIQHIVTSSPRGEAIQKLVDEYVAMVAYDADSSNMEWLTEMAVEKWLNGDAESQSLGRALKSGQLSIVSQAVRSRVNLLPALLRKLQFKIPRVHGQQVMRFDAADSGRMYRPGGATDYAMVNANIDSPHVNYDIDLEAASPEEAQARFKSLFWAELRLSNPDRRDELDLAMARAGRNAGLAADLDALLPDNAGAEAPRALRDIYLWELRLPFEHVFETAWETRPAEDDEMAGGEEDGVRMIYAGNPIVKIGADGQIDAASLRPNMIQQDAADGRYWLRGSLILGDRIPADGVQSIGPAFLHHGFPDAQSNLVEQDPKFVGRTGTDGDGDAPNLWINTGLYDNSPEGIGNRVLRLVADLYLNDPDVIAWSDRGIEKLEKEIIAVMGAELKFGPDAPIKPVTHSNSFQRLEYDYLIGQVGKRTVGIAAKSNTSARRLFAVGGYLDAGFSLTLPSGDIVEISHDEADARAILDPTDRTAWNRVQMALHVSMQMAVSRAVDDGKAFIQGHMLLWDWRLALETTGILFNKAIMHPEREYAENGSKPAFDYEAEFAEAKAASMAMTRAMAASPFLAAVEAEIAPKPGVGGVPAVKRGNIRGAMLKLIDRDFITADERARLASLMKAHAVAVSTARKFKAQAAKRVAAASKLSGADALDAQHQAYAERDQANSAYLLAKLEQKKARSEFLVYETAAGAWVQLLDLSNSLRDFGVVADALVSDVKVATVEQYGRSRKIVADAAATGSVGRFKLLHPGKLGTAELVFEKLSGAMPFAHPSATALGRSVVGAGYDGEMVKLDTALGTLQTMLAAKALVDGEPGPLDFAFPRGRLMQLRAEHPAFFDLLAPSGEFKGSLELLPVYSGVYGLPLSQALVDKAREAFDRMPRKLQIELLVSAVATYDMQTGPRHHSFTMLLGDPETSPLVRELSAAERAVFDRFRTGTDTAPLVDSVIEFANTKYSYAARRAMAVDIFGQAFAPPPPVRAYVVEPGAPAPAAVQASAVAAGRPDEEVAAAAEASDEDAVAPRGAPASDAEMAEMAREIALEDGGEPEAATPAATPDAPSTPAAPAAPAPVSQLRDLPPQFTATGLKGQRVELDFTDGVGWIMTDTLSGEVLTDLPDSVILAYSRRPWTPPETPAAPAQEVQAALVQAAPVQAAPVQAAPNPRSPGEVDARDIRFARHDDLLVTVEQGRALEQIAKFIDDKSPRATRMSELVGYAGTGKTTLVENMVRYGAAREFKVVVVAPTNKAANVLEQKLGAAKVDVESSTFHKWLYKTPEDDGEAVWRPKGIAPGTLAIIDEASMLAAQPYADLAAALAASPGSKTLFLGDNYQLEQVGEASHVLDDELSPVDPKYKATLSGVMRQAADSDVLVTATRLRATRELGVPAKSTDQFRLNDGVNLFKEAYHRALKENSADVAMIVGTNAERIAYNKVARATLFGAHAVTEALLPGDMLMCTTNTALLSNSEQFQVVGPGKASVAFDVVMTGADGKSKTLVDIVRYQGVRVLIGNKQAEITLYLAPELALASLRQPALVAALDKETKDALVNLGDLYEDRRGALKLQPSIVIATYGNAFTAHKAQGSQWGRVFVAQSPFMKGDPGRWLYTAITRAERQVDLLVNPKLHKPFDLDAYRAELNQAPIEFVPRPKATFSTTRAASDYSAAELKNRAVWGMANKAWPGNASNYQFQIHKYHDDDIDAVLTAPTREKAHARLDALARDFRGFAEFDANYEEEFGRWIDHKFGWTGSPRKLLRLENKNARPAQLAAKPAAKLPLEYERPFGEKPNHLKFDTAKRMSTEWMEYHLEGLAEELNLVKLFDLRLATMPKWEAAMQPFNEATTYEEASAALYKVKNLEGFGDAARESMRQWALAKLPRTTDAAEADYAIVARDYVPYLKGFSEEEISAQGPGGYRPGEITYSTTAVLPRFDDVLSPYRGTGASALTRILVDESNKVSAMLAKANRFYERRAVEWGLQGHISKYKKIDFSLDADGKPGAYSLIGRTLWGEFGADKLNEDERKLNALIQIAAAMGLEYTVKPDGSGPRRFDRAEALKKLRVILPFGLRATEEELASLLPKAVAARVWQRMQDLMEPVNDAVAAALADAEAAAGAKLSDTAARALRARVVVGVLGDAVAWTEARFGADDPRHMPNGKLEDDWTALNISYTVPYQFVVDAMAASKIDNPDNALLKKLIDNGRDAGRLTVDTLVDETAGMLDELEKFANDAAPWVLTKDNPYLRMRDRYSPHYFGSGFFGPEERRIHHLVERAISRAKPEAAAKLLEPLARTPVKSRTLDDVPDAMWKMLFEVHGIPAAEAKDARDLLAKGRLGFMGLAPDSGYVDVVSSLRSRLTESFYKNAAEGKDLDAGVPVADALGVARAINDMLGSYKDREFTNRAKARFHKTFEDAFKVSGRRPRNIGALDAVHKYSTDMLLATRNRVIMNQLVQVTDPEGAPLVIPMPNMESRLDDSEEIFTDEAWRIVAARLADWFHDKIDLSSTPRKNVERMVRKHVIGNKSFVEVDSPYASVLAFHTFTRGLGRENILDVISSKGEVAGILKHVVGKPWDDPWGLLKWLDHVNTWMKIQSLQFSMFFPLAGQEGMLAVFGHKFLTTKGGPISSQVEWRRMIKAGHPYAMKLMADAEAIGIQFSSTANPMGLPVGFIERDVDRLANFAGENFGEQSEGVVRWLGGLAKKQTNITFETYYNTIKLWTVYKFAEIEREKAEKAGREFDFAEAMRPYVDYLNAEVGGANWNKYSWMTPTIKRLFSLGMFSVDWTISAWNAAGGGALTAPLLKNYMTEEEYNFVATRRFPQMFLYVLLLVPMIVQAVAYAVALAAGTVEDDDEWLIFNNEAGRKLHADLTPLLRAAPWYKGDPTGERRSYIRWGKQAYETQRWLEAPWNSLMGKSSQIARWAIEQLTGTSGGSQNFPLPFKDQGLMGIVMDKDGGFWGSRLGVTAKKFMPFSLLAWAQNPDAAPLQILGPVSKGMGFYTATSAYQGLLETWSRDTTYGNVYRNPRVKANLTTLGWDILQAAERNGYDAKKVVDAARGAVLKEYYVKLYKGIDANDQAEVERWANCIVRLNGTLQSTLSSTKNRNEMYGRPEKLTDAQRTMIREAFNRP